MSICLHIAYGCFYAIMQELGSNCKDYMVCNTKICIIEYFTEKDGCPLTYITNMFLNLIFI